MKGKTKRGSDIGDGKDGGSGWGLIFCNRVMQSFGGHLRVQSEQGCSTTVTMNFPDLEKERA